MTFSSKCSTFFSNSALKQFSWHCQHLKDTSLPPVRIWLTRDDVINKKQPNLVILYTWLISNPFWQRTTHTSTSLICYCYSFIVSFVPTLWLEGYFTQNIQEEWVICLFAFALDELQAKRFSNPFLAYLSCLCIEDCSETLQRAEMVEKDLFSQFVLIIIFKLCRSWYNRLQKTTTWKNHFMILISLYIWYDILWLMFFDIEIHQLCLYQYLHFHNSNRKKKMICVLEKLKLNVNWKIQMLF